MSVNTGTSGHGKEGHIPRKRTRFKLYANAIGALRREEAENTGLDPRLKLLENCREC